jgi:hypothetical protein
VRPTSDFSRLIWRISARSSRSILGLPPRRQDSQRQYARNPRRCQRSTVSGFTMTMASTTDGNSRDCHTKIRRSTFRKRTHFRDLRLNTSNCWRRTRISASRAGRAESDLATRTSRVAVTHSPALRHADDVLNRDSGSAAPLQRRKMKISTSLHRNTGYFVVGKSRVTVTRSIHRAEPWGRLTKS